MRCSDPMFCCSCKVKAGPTGPKLFFGDLTNEHRPEPKKKKVGSVIPPRFTIRCQSSVARGRWALCALDLGLCDPLVTDDATISRRAMRRQDYLSRSNQTKVVAGGGVTGLGHQGGGACVHLITGAELTQMTETYRGCAHHRVNKRVVFLRLKYKLLCHDKRLITYNSILHSKVNSASSCWSKDGQHSSISDEYTKYSHRHKQYSKSITMKYAV